MVKNTRVFVFLASLSIIPFFAVAQTASEQTALLKGDWSCGGEIDGLEFSAYTRHDSDSLAVGILEFDVGLGKIEAVLTQNWRVQKKDFIEYSQTKFVRMSFSEELKLALDRMDDETARAFINEMRGVAEEAFEPEVQELLLVTKNKHISVYTDPEDDSQVVFTCERITQSETWDRYSILFSD